MKNIIIVIILVAVLFIGYRFYSSPSANPDVLLVQTGTVPGGNGLKIGQETIELLQKLEKVQIDKQLFSTTAFQSLRDFGVPIQPEPFGRPDPFAPVGFENGKIVSSGTTTDGLGR